MDLSFIADWFNSVNGFIDYVWNFLSSGIYDFFKALLVILTKAALYSYLQFQIFMLEVAYEVAQEIMQEVGITQVIQQAWGAIPADVYSTLLFFNVPQGINLILAAIPTRIAFGFIPGVGR